MSSKHRPQNKNKKTPTANKSRQVKKSQVQSKQNIKRLWIYITAALVLVVIGVIALTNKPDQLTALPLDISVDQAAEFRQDLLDRHRFVPSLVEFDGHDGYR